VSENKAAIAPVLGVVGGLVISIYGAYEASLGLSIQSLSNTTGFPVNSSVGIIVEAGWAGVVLGILMMAAAIGIAAAPISHSGLGVLLIVLSIMSLFCVLSLGSLGGGDAIGFLLGVLGGTAGIVVGPPSASIRVVHDSTAGSVVSPHSDRSSHPRPARPHPPFRGILRAVPPAAA
jgi:hypothetical protein